MENTENIKLQLKVQALGESFSQKAVQYENQIADLRVELTLVSQQLQEAQSKVQELEEADVSQEDDK